MSAQPEPNQVLTAESAKLLVKGDVLRVVDPDSFLRENDFPRGSFVTFRSFDGYIDLEDMPFKQGTLPHRFAFVSRPHKDGEGGLGSISAEEAEIPTAQAVMTATLTNAEREGWLAFYAGRSRDACPFPGSRRDLWNDYRGGWDSAERAEHIRRSHGSAKDEKDRELVSTAYEFRAEGERQESHPVAAEGEVEGLGSFSQEAKIPTEQASEVADLLARLDYARGSRDRAHDRAQALYMTLAEVLEQVETYPLDDNTTCMCGSPIEGHNVGSGHAPVSQSDHAISLIVETIQKALGWSALPMGTVEGDCDVSASTCGTDGEAGSLPTPPTPPTTQERIASELPVVVRWSEKVNEWAVDLNDVCIETYADKADADDTARIIRRALLDHREER